MARISGERERRMHKAHDKDLPATNEQVIDPVCGMTVNKQTAAGVFAHQGETYFFCSTRCLERFRKDPDQFQKTPTLVALERPQRTNREYTCPMHPEIVRSEQGNCPICGMALE